MSNDIDQRIQARIGAFITDLHQLVRSAAIDSVRAALEGTRARPLSAQTRGPAGRPTSAAAAQPSRRSKGAKRAPEEIAKTVADLLAAIKAKPGQRIEEIATGLRTATKELALPAKKLLAAKKISTKGQKRATRYYVR